MWLIKDQLELNFIWEQLLGHESLLSFFSTFKKGKVEIRQGAWFEPLEDMKGKIAGIVSNPPYIPTSDLPGLQPEVGWYEPKLALDGGKDGIDHLLSICEGLSVALNSKESRLVSLHPKPIS